MSEAAKIGCLDMILLWLGIHCLVCFAAFAGCELYRLDKEISILRQRVETLEQRSSP